MWIRFVATTFNIGVVAIAANTSGVWLVALIFLGSAAVALGNGMTFTAQGALVSEFVPTPQLELFGASSTFLLVRIGVLHVPRASVRLSFLPDPLPATTFSCPLALNSVA